MPVQVNTQELLALAKTHWAAVRIGMRQEMKFIFKEIVSKTIRRLLQARKRIRPKDDRAFQFFQVRRTFSSPVSRS